MTSIIKLSSELQKLSFFAAKQRYRPYHYKSLVICQITTGPLSEHTHLHLVGLINSAMGMKKNSLYIPATDETHVLLFSFVISGFQISLAQNPQRKVKSFPFKRFTNTKPNPGPLLRMKIHVLHITKPIHK